MPDSIFDKNRINDLVERLLSVLPSGLFSLKKEIESNFRTILQNAFQKMNLVTREEFDIQSKVLERTRTKLSQLEMQLEALEKNQKS